MTTQAPQAAQLCDFCHQKPKFSNYMYCGKTCAGKAGQAPAQSTPAPVPTAPVVSNLCKHCHKKPKFQNFDYCGKSCATQGPTPAPQQQPIITPAPPIAATAQAPAAPAPSTSTLCNHCHKKPKFQNFDYCGKTCAALGPSTQPAAPQPLPANTVTALSAAHHPAAVQPTAVQAPNSSTLCKQCHAKPKFQNFDYCGKYCAALGTNPAPQLAAGHAGSHNSQTTNIANSVVPGAKQ